MDPTQVLTGGLFSLALTAIFLLFSRRVAPALGLIDTPSAHKTHEGEIPLVGGVAILFTLLVLPVAAESLREHLPFFIGGLILCSLGIFDDLRGIAPSIRLVVQALVIVLVGHFDGAFILDLGHIAPDGNLLTLGWFAIPFSVFAGVGLINAFNMSDGIDGLCGSLTLCALAGLGVVGITNGNGEITLLIACLIGGVGAFLFFNLRGSGRPSKRVFLGDAGTYLLGFCLLYIIVKLSQGPERAMTPVTALWFCVVPLLDSVAVMLRRMRNGRSPFAADREHLHHMFALSNFSLLSTLCWLSGAALLAITLSLAGLYAGISERLLMVAFLGVSAGYYVTATRVWKSRRFLGRRINRRIGADRRRRTAPFSIAKGGIERRFNERRQGVPI